ncbi:MAG TPA: UBP-type zinc finger domain-containing protein, partial [Burkholderiaceae bacterium]|nr:UBP-type zinc finger domain-containing protein [Burkholderiaceae bacterium]
MFVQSITFQSPEQPSSFPNMTNDPFLPDSQPSGSSNAAVESPIATSLTAKPLAPPTPALIELPTCPVCLERMDETTGLLTILCQHVFHCACLERWKGTGCPVCRYTQNSAAALGVAAWRAGGGALPEDYPTECSVCGALDNLWVCLICGNLGCGRYDGAHAFAHYEATRHSYAMGIATQHVWDYAGDGYVHRLIQNKADGKLLDLPAVGADPGGRGRRGDDGGLLAVAGAADMVPRAKMDAMGNEYAYLLTDQLDSQRAYFEEQLERAADKARKAAVVAEKAAEARDTLARKLDELTRAHEEAMAQARQLGRDVERERARAEKSVGVARGLGKDWREEKTVNGALMERIAFLDKKVADEEAA